MKSKKAPTELGLAINRYLMWRYKKTYEELSK